MEKNILMNMDAHLHQEFAQFLRLSNAQLLSAVDESTESLDDLTHSFIRLIKDTEWLMKAITEVHASEEYKDMDPRIVATSDDIHRQVRSAVIAFQFFDKLTQRLDHVTTCLKGIEEIIDHHPEDSSTHTLLLELDEQLQSLYSMENEKIMHEVMQEVHGLPEALREYKVQVKAQGTRGLGGQVDLF